jgi:hypothetical protein
VVSDLGRLLIWLLGSAEVQLLGHDFSYKVDGREGEREKKKSEAAISHAICSPIADMSHVGFRSIGRWISPIARR